MRGGVSWSSRRGSAIGILDSRHTAHIHLGHSLLYETLALNRLLVSLITKVLLDASTHGNGALVLIAALCM